MRDRYERDGLLILERFMSAEACDALIARANELVAAFEPATVSVFSTKDQTRTSDAYFLGSGDQIETVIDDQYRNERRLAAILNAAALLALAVACLGLYGLSSFITESRKKEIAIRKILGASTADVVRLLAWQLARPVALACAVGAPLAYLAGERWLARFAYRIEIGPGWIAAAIAAALALAASTVAIQSLRSARATPVDALRAS